MISKFVIRHSPWIRLRQESCLQLQRRLIHAQKKLLSRVKWESSSTPTPMKKKPVKHLVDAEYLQRTVQCLKEHFDIQTSTILQVNAGPGKLSSCLLQHNAQQVVAYESKSIYSDQLTDLMEIHGDAFSYIRGNLYTSKDIHGPVTAWHEKCPVQVVGSVQSGRYQNLVYTWVENLATQSGIYAHGRLEQYLFIDASELALIEESKKALAENREIKLPNRYQRPSRAVFYPLFFDIDVLMQIPSACFEPMTGERKDVDDAQYLVRIVPKLDLYEMYDCDRLPEFVSFVRNLMGKLNYQVRLIPCIETLIPGIGLWLVNEGYTMLQHGYYFKLKDYWRLFKAILDHPSIELPAFSARQKKLTD